MDLWKHMSSSKCSFTCICGIFWPLNPSTTTVYVRSAFYPSLRFTLSLQSAFYTQSAFYPWSAICSPQSAVRSLLVKKFYLFTVHFSTAPLRNFDKGRMCYLWPRLCSNLSFLLHSVSRLGVVVGGNFNPAQDVLISCIHCWTQTLFIFAVYTFGM